MAKEKKYYVVWSGNQPGVYDTWEDCKAQVHGVKGAVYKSFKTKDEADSAFSDDASHYVFRKTSTKEHHSSGHKIPEGVASYAAQGKRDEPINAEYDKPGGLTWAVDAACSGNPGKMEYQGVLVPEGKQIFHFGPVHGTNNIGEFLAIVHALALAHQQGITHLRIYSDSRNAMGWIRKKKCKTKLARTSKTEKLYQMIERAEQWLETHPFTIPIYKWNTEEWGEIPADFGRK